MENYRIVKSVYVERLNLYREELFKKMGWRGNLDERQVRKMIYDARSERRRVCEGK